MPAIRRPETESHSSEVFVIGGSRLQFSALSRMMRRHGLGKPVTKKKIDAPQPAGDNVRRVYVLGSTLDSRQTIDLLDKLRSELNRALVVVLRDEGDREFLIDCFRHGAVEVLSGPVTAPDWWTRLGHWLSPRGRSRSDRSN